MLSGTDNTIIERQESYVWVYVFESTLAFESKEIHIIYKPNKRLGVLDILQHKYQKYIIFENYDSYNNRCSAQNYNFSLSFAS